jgi:hypothetical protein
MSETIEKCSEQYIFDRLYEWLSHGHIDITDFGIISYLLYTNGWENIFINPDAEVYGEWCGMSSDEMQSRLDHLKQVRFFQEIECNSEAKVYRMNDYSETLDNRRAS